MLSTYYAESPFLTMLVVLYCALVIVKLVLCMASLHVAVPAIAKAGEAPAWLYYVLVPIALVLTLPLYVLKSLYEERLSFFVLYPPEVVLSQIERANAE